MDTVTEDRFVSRLAAEMARDRRYRDVFGALSSRQPEFGSKLEMRLAAIAMHPEGRARLDDRLQELWAGRRVEGSMQAGEAIIGGGFHAATYAATRVALGHPRPLVLERSRVGGVFAMSRKPSFRLNSRNRPGRLGLPGTGAALNYLPGAPVQPASLSANEFQTNAEIAWVVRATLGEFADVRTGANVISVTTSSDPDRGELEVELETGTRIFCKRVLDARGLGDAKYDRVAEADGASVITFPRLMARVDAPFPLRGMKRVAVVGAGDAARCAVEMLLGLGPASHMSVAALDYVEHIDWYGPELPLTTREWNERERCRYEPIGAYLPRVIGEPSRVSVFPQTGFVDRGFGGAYVNDRFYDHVVLATGFSRAPMPGLYVDMTSDVGFKPVIATAYRSLEAFALGPVARIAATADELDGPLGRVPRNADAIWRLAERTAALASRLRPV